MSANAFLNMALAQDDYFRNGTAAKDSKTIKLQQQAQDLLDRQYKERVNTFMQYLLQQNIIPNDAQAVMLKEILIADSTGQTAFIRAIRSNNPRFIVALHQAGYKITPNILIETINTPRHDIKTKTLKTVINCCDHTTLNSRMLKGQTPLITAVKKGNVRAARILSQHPAVSLTAVDTKNHTALYYAAKSSQKVRTLQTLKTSMLDRINPQQLMKDLEAYKQERKANKTFIKYSEGDDREQRITELQSALQQLINATSQHKFDFTSTHMTDVKNAIAAVEQTGGSTTQWKRSLVSIFSDKRSHFDDIVTPIKKVITTAARDLPAGPQPDHAQRPFATSPVA